MSGTSLDGLDMAYCHFWQEEGQWHFEIRKTRAVSYSEKMFGQLQNAIKCSEAAHQQLHKDYGKWLGEQAKSFIREKKLEVDFVASHGHTSHHRPEEGITFQLGEGQALANASGHKVICDFRTLDVKRGGQGAPLVPIGDDLLLPEYDFCLNLGGISNISFKKEGKRLAYDIGLANMPLNHVAQKRGYKYDKDGKLAKKGKLIPELLDALNALKYYAQPYPKSTGLEWFKKDVLPLLEEHGESEDILHTLVHHNCEQIAIAIQKEHPENTGKLLVTGGGALNPFFMETLKEKLQGIYHVVLPPKKFIAYKEAMVFAFMGVLKNLNQTNVYATVTGAQKDSSSGEVFYPKGI